MRLGNYPIHKECEEALILSIKAKFEEDGVDISIARSNYVESDVELDRCFDKDGVAMTIKLNLPKRYCMVCGNHLIKDGPNMEILNNDIINNFNINK